MTPERLIYVFDMEPELSGRLWEDVLPLVDPDDLLYAVWNNFYHNESYYLDTIFENHMEEDSSNANAALCNWIDEFYVFWEPTIYKIKNGSVGYVLSRCHLVPNSTDVYIEFNKTGT